MFSLMAMQTVLLSSLSSAALSYLCCHSSTRWQLVLWIQQQKLFCFTRTCCQQSLVAVVFSNYRVLFPLLPLLLRQPTMACANGSQYMTHVTWLNIRWQFKRMSRTWQPHSRLVCIFPDFRGPICTLFFILFEHSMWSRCLLAHCGPLRSGACGIFGSQTEIAQMSTQSPRVNTVSVQQTQQMQLTGSQAGSSQIFNGYFMYRNMLCANMVPAQCVDPSGFKA